RQAIKGPATILAGQSSEEFDDRPDFTLGQLTPELASCHDPDSVVQRCSSAIVKVRCRYGNVPKARDTEHASVAFAPRDREAAEIGSPRAPPPPQTDRQRSRTSETDCRPHWRPGGRHCSHTT